MTGDLLCLCCKSLPGNHLRVREPIAPAVAGRLVRALFGVGGAILMAVYAAAVPTAAAQTIEGVYLDEPEPAPEPTVVERAQKVPEKYADGSLRSERDLLRLSDNQIVNHGAYTEYYENGQKFAEGSYNMGVHHGAWTFWHENGQLCKKVSFEGGVANGAWEVFDRDGKVKQKKSYKMGKRDGKWVFYFADADQPRSELSFKDGVLDGDRVFYFANGKVRQKTSFKAGKPEGKSEEWDESGRQRADMSFVNGRAHGERRFWDSNGMERVRIYEDGKLVRSEQAK